MGRSVLRKVFTRPVGIAVFIASFVFVLTVAPPPGEILVNAMRLQEWLREPLGFGPATATRAESIFGSGLLIALLVSAFNWVDALLDFMYQYPYRVSHRGDWLTARSNFRRESFRLWRLFSMVVICLSLFFNWGLTTLLFTFGLLIHAYSEAVNSTLDRLYRIGAQQLFREERERRRKLAELARQARSAKVVADAASATQTARLEVLEAEHADRGGRLAEQADRMAEQADRMEAQSGDTNERVRQVVRDIVVPRPSVEGEPGALMTIGEQIQETHELATEALRTSNRAEETSTRAEESAARAEATTAEQNEGDHGTV